MYALTCFYLSCTHWWQVKLVSHGLNGCVLYCSQNDFHGFTLLHIQIQQIGLQQTWETLTRVNDTEYHTLSQHEQMTLSNTFCSHDVQHRQPYSAPEFCCLLCEHSSERDPKVSETICVFHDFSIEGGHWHSLSHCFVAKGEPQSLHLAWDDFGPCLLAFFSSSSGMAANAVWVSLAVL